MTTQTVGNAVAQRDNGPTALVERHADQFSAVLPSHIQPSTFVGLAVGALHRNADLMRAASANPSSFINALLDCARLGHEPGTESYYLVPFGTEVVGIEGYRGEIERIYRAGAVASIKAEVVYATDVFRYSPSDDKPHHEIDWDAADRGPMRLVYAYAVMKDGSTSKVVILNKTQIDKHKKEARGATGTTSPWVKWTESMWLKTAIHQLEKWVPSSAEYRREQLRAAVEADNLRRHTPLVATGNGSYVDTTTGEITEAEVLPDGDDKPIPPQLIDSRGDQMKRLHGALNANGLKDRDSGLGYISTFLKRDITSTAQLTVAEASAVINALEQPAFDGGPTDAA